MLAFEKLLSFLTVTEAPVYTEVVDKLPLLHLLGQAGMEKELGAMPFALHNRKVGNVGDTNQAVEFLNPPAYHPVGGNHRARVADLCR